MRILLVEDSPADAELIERELKRGNITCTVTRVDTEDALLASLTAALPDLVLLDFSLPTLNAPHVLGLMSDQHPTIPVIVVTGTIGDEMAALCIKLGASDFVLKQRMGRLPSAINNALAEQEARRARDAELAALKRDLEDCRRILRGH